MGDGASDYGRINTYGPMTFPIVYRVSVTLLADSGFWDGLRASFFCKDLDRVFLSTTSIHSSEKCYRKADEFGISKSSTVISLR